MLTIEDLGHSTRVLQKHSIVVFKFKADWCGPCKAIAPAVEKLAQTFPKVMFAEVDIDKASDVAQEYTVSAVPTLIVFKNSNEIERIVGGNLQQLMQCLRSIPDEFGRGQKIGGSSTQLSVNELRELRARKFAVKREPEESQDPKETDDSQGSKGTQGKAQKAEKSCDPSPNPDSTSEHKEDSKGTPKLTRPTIIKPPATSFAFPSALAIVFFIKLYFLTLFSFDSRTQALKMARSRN